MSCSMTWIMLQTCWKTTDAHLEKGFRHTAEKKASLFESLQLASLPFWQRGGWKGPPKGSERAFGAKMKGMRRSWRDRKSRGLESGVRWEQASGWEATEAAEQMWAELMTDELHAKTPSRWCRCYSLGGEENRDKIKLQASTAHNPAARAANKLTNRQSFSEQLYIGFELLHIKI